MISQTQNQVDVDIANFGRLMLLMVLTGAMLIQETLWIATRDDIHLMFLLLEAAAASMVLRLVFRNIEKLAPDLPALPPIHFIAISTYTLISAFLIMMYFEKALQLGAVHILWGVLLAVLLFISIIVEAITPSQKQTEPACKRV
jgi:hypothetical protein